MKQTYVSVKLVSIFPHKPGSPLRYHWVQLVKMSLVKI